MQSQSRVQRLEVTEAASLERAVLNCAYINMSLYLTYYFSLCNYRAQQRF